MDNIIKEMTQRASNALENAYAPYSKFTVASCIHTEQGNFYTGINIENGAYGLTICAEACAICNMVSSGEQQIKSIVIIAGNNLLCPPCGACRQRIHEFSTPETIIHLCSKEKTFESITIDKILPMAFDFKP